MSTFLIADDSDGKRLMLRMLIQKSDISDTILEASSTKEAKEIINDTEIDYAFIDYEIPTEHGPAVIGYLKEKHPQAKIALVSSSDSERYKTDALEAGAQSTICTSYAEDIVKDSIENLLIEWK